MRPILLSSLSIVTCFALIRALHTNSPTTRPSSTLIGPVHIRSFKTRLFAVTINNKTGYIDSTGKLILPAIYSCGGEFAEGLAPVRLKGRYGYVDETGNWIIQPQFDWAGPFSNGMAIVTQKGIPQYIDYTGRSPFPCDFEELGPFHYGVAIVKSSKGKYGLIDRSGRLILDTDYDLMSDFNSGVAIVEVNGKHDETWAIVDTTGHFIVPPGIYQTIHDFSDDYAVVYRSSDQTSGVIDRSGKLIFARPPKDTATFFGESFHDGLAVVLLEKKPFSSSHVTYQGYINIHNQIVLTDTTVKEASAFSNGRAFIKREDWTYTLINTRMEPVGNTKYKGVDNNGFINGHAYVKTDTGWGVIDTNGRFTVAPTSLSGDKAGIIGDYFFPAKIIDGHLRYGISTTEGKLICKPILQDFDGSGFQNGLLKVLIDDRLAFMNTSGVIIWQAPQINTLPNFNIDYLLRGYFCAYSTPTKTETARRGGGWYISKNIPIKGSPRTAPPQTLSLIIDTLAIDTFDNHYQGYPVYLANTTPDTWRFDASDSRLYMQIQALNEKGNWQYIDYLPSSWCGNSYHTLELEPGAYWKFTLPRFEGEMPTKLRIELLYKDKLDPKKDKTLYSNSITGFVNPGQFWNKRRYYPQGIMDPYND